MNGRQDIILCLLPLEASTKYSNELQKMPFQHESVPSHHYRIVVKIHLRLLSIECHSNSMY